MTSSVLNDRILLAVRIFSSPDLSPARTLAPNGHVAVGHAASPADLVAPPLRVARRAPGRPLNGRARR
jgi:hypothetical protein